MYLRTTLTSTLMRKNHIKYIFKSTTRLIIGSSLVLTTSCSKVSTGYHMNNQASASSTCEYRFKIINRNHNHAICINKERLYERLHESVQSGNLKETKLLLKDGYGFFRQNKALWNPLHWAAKNGYTDLCYQLLRYTNIDINKKDVQGRTALHYAVERGHISVLNILVKHPYNISRINISAKDKNGVIPLHLAAEKGYIKIVELLVNNGSKINAQDKDGLSPLHLAAEKGHLEVVEFLIEKCAKIHLKDKNNYNPLHLSIQKSDLKVIKCLLRKAVNITNPIKRQKILRSLLESRTILYETALDIANSTGDRQCINCIKFAHKYIDNSHTRCLVPLRRVLSR